jgi:hypothetical protein
MFRGTRRQQFDGADEADTSRPDETGQRTRPAISVCNFLGGSAAPVYDHGRVVLQSIAHESARMIDFATETVIPLTQATARIPRRRGGKKTHVSTVYRWTTVGCRGIVLEWLMVGGTRCTSIEALQRFFDRLTAGVSGSERPERGASSEKQMDRVERELDRIGL